jgi:hypothetical protein
LNRSSICCPACPAVTHGGRCQVLTRGRPRSTASADMRAGVRLHRPWSSAADPWSMVHCPNLVTSKRSFASVTKLELASDSALPPDIDPTMSSPSPTMRNALCLVAPVGWNPYLFAGFLQLETFLHPLQWIRTPPMTPANPPGAGLVRHGRPVRCLPIPLIAGSASGREPLPGPDRAHAGNGPDHTSLSE